MVTIVLTIPWATVTANINSHAQLYIIIHSPKRCIHSVILRPLPLMQVAQETWEDVFFERMTDVFTRTDIYNKPTLVCDCVYGCYIIIILLTICNEHYHIIVILALFSSNSLILCEISHRPPRPPSLDPEYKSSITSAVHVTIKYYTLWSHF